jgi:hypothetical protein
MADPHKIVIQTEIFGAAVEVRIRPVPGGPGHDREFRTVAAAREYACRLAAATGWGVVDLCDGEAT